MEKVFLKREPTELQKEAIETLKIEPRQIIADSTGLGKTFLCLAAYAELLKVCNHHLLVCCSPSSIGVWKKEISNYTEFNVRSFDVDNYEQDAFFDIPTVSVDWDITLITYSTVLKFKLLLRKIYKSKDIILVMDEYHKLKNPESQRSKTVQYLIKYAKRAWGLTATPLLNNIMDLYHLVGLLFPGCFGTEFAFQAYYTIQRKREVRVKTKTGAVLRRTIYEIIGTQHEVELRERLKGKIIQRLLKLDVRYHVKQLLPSKDEFLLYLRAATGYLELSYREFVGRLPHLQQVCDHAILENGVFNEDEAIHTKEQLLLDLVKEQLQKGLGSIIYTNYRNSQQRVLLTLQRNLLGTRVFTINGDTSAEERSRIETEFGPQDLIVMTDAGGESLNLQKVINVIFYSLPFNIGTIIQVIGRIARQDTPFDHIDVYILELQGTIDTYKQMMFVYNADTINRILNGNTNIPKTVGKVKKDLIVRMRRDLLWKKKQLKDIEDGKSVEGYRV